MQTKNKLQTEKLAMLSVLTAIVAVLAYLGAFIPIGIASINLTLIPVVIGAALYGPLAGAWLGGVSGVIILATGQAAPFMVNLLSDIGIPITVMLKGILSGFCTGLVYRLLEKKNRYLAVFVSAIVCPLVNTGIYVLGLVAFLFSTVQAVAVGKGISMLACLIFVYVGLNVVFEVLVNVVFAPAILRIINIKKKKS